MVVPKMAFNPDDEDPALSQAFERETLHSVELEMMLLGGALQGDHMARWFALNVPPSAFYRQFHRVVASEITAMVGDGILPDINALRARLAARDALTQSTITQLDEIECCAFSSAMVKAHAEVILGFATRRSLRARAQAIMNLCDSGAEDLDKIIQKGFSLVRNLPKIGTDTVMSADFDFMSLGAKLPGVPTPWKQLNDACNGAGWYLGDMAIVMGHRGSGKTGTLIDAAITAHRAGHRPAYITLEMTAENIVKRQLKSLCGMDKPPKDALRFAEFQDAVEFVKDMNMPIYDPRQMAGGSRSVEGVASWCHDMHSTHGVNLFLVDYAQKLTSNRKTENKTREMDYCADILDDVAKTTGAAIVVGSQRSIDGHNKNDWRSKDSIKWEDNAALVVQLRRKPDEDEAKINISKNREDFEPSFPVKFIGPQVKYVETDYDPFADRF